MNLGVNGVGDGALDHKPAKGMADQNRVLPFILVKVARCLGKSCNGIEAIVVAGEPFGGCLAIVKRELAHNRRLGNFAAPSEIDPDYVKTAVRDHWRFAQVLQPFGKFPDVIRPGAIMPAVNIGDHERPGRLFDQIDCIIDLARVLIRTLFTKLDERERVALVRIGDRLLGIVASVAVERT
jgi:hypothetical protein